MTVLTRQWPKGTSNSLRCCFRHALTAQRSMRPLRTFEFLVSMIKVTFGHLGRLPGISAIHFLGQQDSSTNGFGEQDYVDIKKEKSSSPSPFISLSPSHPSVTLHSHLMSQPDQLCVENFCHGISGPLGWRAYTSADGDPYFFHVAS